MKTSMFPTAPPLFGFLLLYLLQVQNHCVYGMCDLMTVANGADRLVCPPSIRSQVEHWLFNISSCVLEENRRIRSLRAADYQQNTRGLQKCCCCCSCSAISYVWWCRGPCIGGKRHDRELGQGEQEEELEEQLNYAHEDQEFMDAMMKASTTTVVEDDNNKVLASATTTSITAEVGHRQDLGLVKGLVGNLFEKLETFDWSKIGMFPLVNTKCIPIGLPLPVITCLTTSITVATNDCK
ncbi:hypothetical protein ACA910_006451 [Epithemia clementina (nom. ined.)]